MGSFNDATEELSQFKRAGGQTVVDVSPKNTGEYPEAVRRVANQMELTMIHGTAYYSGYTHPDHVKSASIDEIAEEFVDDVHNGISDTDVRAGIIGEIGLSEMAPREKHVLRAGARAARRTGAPLSIHPPLHHERSPSEYALEILDIVTEEGLNPGQVVLDHQDYCDEIEHPGVENQRELAQRGAYVEFDLWGWGMYIESEQHASPSDNWRARATIELIEDGYVDNLLFSHDICTNPQRRKYGGFGYSHILDNVVPMLSHHGVSERDIERIIRDNPQRMLTFAQPEADI